MLVTMAPLEGITGYLYRNAHAAVFGPADKYMTPFLSPTLSGCFTHREKQEVDPAHNRGLNVVPQILANNADHFNWAARELSAMGYREVNLNLGCPSGTVTSKGKGAGFLARREELDRFLDHIFSACTVDISVKTRVGRTDPEEFAGLLEIYNRYPICELTVHPRVQTDLYRGTPRMESFALAASTSRAPLCYNGDLFSAADLARFSGEYPQIRRVMAGRGVIANPALLRQLAGGQPATAEELRAFHDKLYRDYRDTLPGPRPVLAKMKELWAYMSFSFENRDKAAKPIRKATRLDDYELAVDRLFREHRVIPGGSFEAKNL